MTDKGRKNKQNSSKKVVRHKVKKSHSFVENKQEKNTQVPIRTISKQRIWLFRLIAITIIPIVFLLLLEGTLRIAHFGFPTESIIK